MDIFSLTVMLFLIIDPFGNISSYLHLVKGFDKKKQHYILLREMLIALFVMLAFNFLGEYIFNVLHVSEKTLRISSGVILFLVGIKILFPAIDSPRANLPSGEPFLVPLAIPLIAGPSLLATIMLFAHIVPDQSVMISSILIAWLLSLAILFSGPFLLKKMGSNGLVAMERLMGMVLVLIAIQRFLEGIQQFIECC